MRFLSRESSLRHPFPTTGWDRPSAGDAAVRATVVIRHSLTLKGTPLKAKFLQIGIALLVLGCIGQFWTWKAEAANLTLSSSQATHISKGCHKGRDIYGRLQSYCHAGNRHIDSLCVNDDGLCCETCAPLSDNDCKILATLLSTHEFLLSRKSSQGYTPDPRDSLVLPQSEFYRLVPCMQAQGYLNLYACTGEKRFLEEACDRLDFIAAHLSNVLSGTCYDGQLGWTFLDAYNYTCNEEYLRVGLKSADQILTLGGSCQLNWGLLGAMNTVSAYEVTGDETYLSFARDCVRKTLKFQNADGSFPHQARLSRRNLPYTSWLLYEMVCYAVQDPTLSDLTGAIDRSATLLGRQMYPDGHPRYDYDSLVIAHVPDPVCLRCAAEPSAGCEDYCTKICVQGPELPPCWCLTDPYKHCPNVDTLVNITYYDEEAAGYDVRGWTSELPSTAFVLGSTGRLNEKWGILRFLLTLQNSDGSFPDKWGFYPGPTEPMWTFSSETHSVIRTSCVFFYLSGLLRTPGRTNCRSHAVASATEVSDASTGERDASHEGITPETNRLVVNIRPNPLLGSAVISYRAGGGFPCRVSIADISGRVVRKLFEGPGGERTVTWDGCDDGGRRVSPGIYFVIVASGLESRSTKIVFLAKNR